MNPYELITDQIEDEVIRKELPLYFNMNRDIISIDWIMGSFMMLRKQDYYSIGG